MGVQDIIAIGVAVAAALWILRMFTKTFNGERGCGCAANPSDANQGACGKDRTGLRRRPIVPLESVGRPEPTHPTDRDH